MTTKGDLQASILATIRQMESGNYSQPPNAGGASGAYQYIDSTWATQATAAGYGQYASQPAYLAPPSVQDAVAANNVQQILNQYHSVSAVPLAWYYPAAIGNPALLNTVPDPQAGNTETPAQYAAAWLNVFDSLYNGTAAPTPTVSAPSTPTLTSSSSPTTASAPAGTFTKFGLTIALVLGGAAAIYYGLRDTINRGKPIPA